MNIEEKILKCCSNEIFSLSEIISKNGGKLFIVGGYLRDLFIGRESKDIDIEIMGMSFEKVINLIRKMGKAKIVGNAFPVILYENIEIAVNESKFKGEDSIREAASRRDFTINSIYFDMETKKIYDFYNGITDIENKKINIIKESNIKDDSARILRAFQFQSRFDFEIDKECGEYLKKYLELTYNLPKERVFIEIEKILMKSEKPSKAFWELKKIGWLKRVFPELDILETVEQGKKYHPEGNVFIHTMLALDFLPLKEREIDVMFAILFHDIGKAVVPNIVDGDNIHFYGHDKIGSKMVNEILSRTTEKKEILEMVAKLIEYHMYPLQIKKEISSKGIKKIASKVNFEKLMKLHKADMGGKGIKFDTLYIEQAIKIYIEKKDEIKPIISGKDLIALGIKPGIEMGEYLKKIYEAQLDEIFMNYEEGIEYAKKITDL